MRWISTDREAGFTLIELLVVMLILGALAAIALPAFFSQTTKAGDAKAKATVSNARIAMETCRTDSSTSVYTNCDLAALRKIEPTLPSTGLTVTKAAATYTLEITSSSENTFSIARDAAGVTTYECTVKSTGKRGGCPGTGTSGTWG